MRLFLSGDVMTGRGIDQVLTHPSDPKLHEPSIRDARGYVRLAEDQHGPLPRPVSDAYIWGDALEELGRLRPDVRIINLETSVTTSDAAWPGKGIHYRMHPRNVGCLTAAAIDCCCLANNHVMDWGEAGLLETLETLEQAGLRYAGAGRDAPQAESPAVLDVPGGRRVMVFALGSETAGLPPQWQAGTRRPGVWLLPDLSVATAERMASRMQAQRRPRDILIASIHWGGNWGYAISRQQQDFAHRLVDGGVDIVHGHSAHHVKAMEIYRNRLILYGCGDLLTDYEGISGHEDYRGDLSLLYLPELDDRDGSLVSLRLAPMQMRGFRLKRPAPEDRQWLHDLLNREGKRFGIGVEATDDGHLLVNPS